MRLHREEKTIQSGRLRFALLGALACLGMALGSELVFSLLHMEQTLQRHQVPVLLFPIIPEAPMVVSAPPPTQNEVPEPSAPQQEITLPSEEQRRILQTSCYLVDTNGKMGRIDVATGEFTLISTLPRNLTDIAYDSRGQLYATGYPEADSQGSFQALFRIDPHTGESSQAAAIRGFNMGNTIAGLVFSPDDVLLGATKDGRLIQIDVSTGEWQVWMTFPYSTAGDLAFDRDGNLYVSTESNEIVRLEPGAGKYQAIGPMGFSGVRGLGRGPDDVMYGFSFSEKKVFAIDLQTGQGRPVSDFSRGGIGIGGGISFATEVLPLPDYHPTAPTMRAVLEAKREHRTLSSRAVAPPTAVLRRWRNPLPALLTVVFWTALLGAALPLILRTAQKSFLEEPLRPEREDWQAVGYGGGFGAAAGFAGQAIYTLALFGLPSPLSWILHALGFALLGGLLGNGLSRCISHISRRAATLVVPLGALVASIGLQLAINGGSPIAGRLLAATLLGASVGILIALVKVEEIVHTFTRPLLHASMRSRSSGSLSRSRERR